MSNVDLAARRRGPGSLRQAILDANAVPGPHRIKFRIPGTGVKTIAPVTPLPPITRKTRVNGYSQPGAQWNTRRYATDAKLRIELSGANLTSGPAAGLTMDGLRSMVAGLVINRFPGPQIEVLEGTWIRGCFLGTNPRGTAAGQSWWQVLPLGPPGDGDSPYTATSAFAAWNGLLADPDAPVSDEEAERFRAANAYWIDDWVAFAGGDALADQVRFDREWGDLRRYAASRGVRIMGDLPIFVAGASADVLAHPELFGHDFVAGAPPDDFSATGQLWGNPVYRWRAARHEGYRWWIERFRRAFTLFDAVRIDHFRGFVSYWAVPAGAKDASAGRWKRGPGRAVFDAAASELGLLDLVAEDLGHITPAVARLRDELGLLGMVVLQFGFEGRRDSPHRLENHVANAVAYTGTHDHDTALGWWRSLDEGTRERARRYLVHAGIQTEEPHWALVELAYRSPARLAIVQAQDALGLGSDARMNTPGEPEGNWGWHLEPGQLTDELAARLREITERTSRAPG